MIKLNGRSKICVITGSRAEYGLLKGLMQDIKNQSGYILQIYAIGTHLDKQYGNTINEILNDSFQIAAQIGFTKTEDSFAEMSEEISYYINEVTSALQRDEPDLVVVLGDRYEIFASAIAAFNQRIPIAHLHGGEKTDGAIDDIYRQCITKLSNLHFVANKTYRKRVIQIGEDPNQVFDVGGLGVDAISKTKLMDKNELEIALDIKFQKRNVLVTYHPTTNHNKDDIYNVRNLLSALSSLQDTLIIITSPNSDPGHKEIVDLMQDYIAQHPSMYYYNSLGSLIYLSTLARVDFVIGNSSSGIAEAPYLDIPTINIGTRQSGRDLAQSILQVDGSREEIMQAINIIFSGSFRYSSNKRELTYGEAGASKKIIDILQEFDFAKLNPKKFYDLEFELNE